MPSSEDCDVNKIKFPHGVRNTVKELMDLKHVPLNDKDWYNTLQGSTPDMKIRKETRDVFIKQGYKNMYRLEHPLFSYHIFIYSLLCGIYVKKDVVGAYVAFMRFRKEVHSWTDLGIIIMFSFFSYLFIIRSNSRTEVYIEQSLF